MSNDTAPLPDWEQVLSSAAHRMSRDADHVLTDLRERFDAVLAALESVAGWTTARVQRPVQILGSLDGIETGIRQLIRAAPLETTVTEIDGARITIPTASEMLRIKAVLILKRNAVRDYLDFVAMADHLGADAAATALQSFDALYRTDHGESPLQQLQVQLAHAMPYDLEGTDLGEYRHLDPRWRDWAMVQAACARWATTLFDQTCERIQPRPQP